MNSPDTEGTDAQSQTKLMRAAMSALPPRVPWHVALALSLLARAGFLNGAQLRAFRKYAVLAIAVAAAVLSPPDPFSMLAMMAPTILLYEASIWIVDRIVKAREARQTAAT